MSPFHFDDDLRMFLRGGNSVIVATRSAKLEPHATRACGLRIDAPDRVSVMLPRATSAQSLLNLRDNGEVAVCVGSPLTYRTVQLKGRYVASRDSEDEDVAHSQQLFQRFADACVQLGQSRQQVRNAWFFDNWCVEIRVTQAYVQTPGPGAGARLSLQDDDR